MRTKHIHTNMQCIARVILAFTMLVFFAGKEAVAEEIYLHNFNNKNASVPGKKDVRMLSTGWTVPGYSPYFRTDDGAVGLAIYQATNYTYVLTIQMQDNYQTEITSINFKRNSSDNAVFQFRVAGVDYGTSFGSTLTLAAATRTKTVSKLRGTFKVEIVVKAGTNIRNNFSQIDDVVLNGNVTAYNPSDDATPNASGVFYVDKNVGNIGNGSSWSKAFSNFNDALDAARLKPQIKEIWVADGEYQRAGDNQSFSMVSNVKIYGGFAGTEDAVSKRDVMVNKTILKGKATAVIYNDGIDNTARLDGFYVRQGKGFLHNGMTSGGGMYNNNSSPVIANCTFNGNQAGSDAAPGRGGAIYNLNSNPAITQCLFYDNKANGSSKGAGAAIFNDNASPVIINCTITRNDVEGESNTGNGAGIGNTGSSSPIIKNCIIWENYDNGRILVSSAISSLGAFNGTPAVSYSLVQGGYPGGENVIDTDPLFEVVFPATYRQTTRSTAINLGDQATDLEGFPTNAAGQALDLSGSLRLQNGVIDLGVFEVVAIKSLRVNAASTAQNPDGLSWENAFPTLQQALALVKPGEQIWVAQGEYRPASGLAFRLADGIEYYGGFRGNETGLSGRPFPIPKGNVPGATILRGNGARVVEKFVVNNTDTDDIIEGFTIKGGRSATGAGILIRLGKFTINDCAIIENEATDTGGGISVTAARGVIKNTVFSSNSATGANAQAVAYGGGVITDQSSNVTFSNCLFFNNSSFTYGGAIVCLSPISLDHCTISRNTAPTGGSVIIAAQSEIRNSIITGNSTDPTFVSTTTVYTSIVESLAADQALIRLDGATDPCFADPLNFDFRLRSSSPAINRAAPYNELGMYDVGGNLRKINGLADLGAFEYQGSPVATALPSANVTVDTYMAGPPSAFSVNCETIALLEAVEVDGFAGFFSVKNYIATAPTISAGLKVFVKRHIDITQTISSGDGSSGNVTLFFTKQEFDDYNTAYGNANNAALPAKLKVVQYHGTSATGLPESYSGETEIIEDVEVTTTPDGNIYIVKFSVTGLSGFFISGQPATALPVTLSEFNVTGIENAALAQWQTTSESNSAAFEIQHSLDGKTWQSVGRVKASGESAAVQSYEFKHENPARGVNLYRLKMIDLDSTFAFSTIRNVNFESTFTIQIYPNPVSNFLTIKLDGTPSEDIKELKLINNEGKVVYQAKTSQATGIDVSHLRPGTYVAQITLKSGSKHSSKLLVAR